MIRILAVILVLIMMFVVCDVIAADLPEYADLTFTDMADLDAQVDSVLGVCDSAMTKAQVDSLVRDGWDVYNPVLCRQWAGLTVFEMPKPRKAIALLDGRVDSVLVDTATHGKARLWWWEKE